jgi:radical SAM superfamily enzyme YgiQ (UPF0313 family)
LRASRRVPADRDRSRFGREWDPVTLEEVAVLPVPQGGDPSWALVFPSDYGTGISNLGFHYVFYHLKRLGVGVERFFLSPIPNLSIENHRPLQDFPIITASIAYEPDALNFLQLLRLAGIPLRRRQRDSGEFPLIGAAGAFTSINPAMLLAVADFIVLGDGEPVIPHLVACFRNHQPGAAREKLLRALDQHPSVLVPGLGEEKALDLLGSGVKTGATTPCGQSVGHGIWITPKSAFGETLLLELQRGCTRGCPYCVLPACFSPLRQRPLDRVIETLEECASRVPFGQVGLVTPEAGDYPGLEMLLDRLEELNKGVSFASLRVDNLTRRMVRALRQSGRESLTIAPETGTDRMRLRCGKPFTNREILDKLEMASIEGMKKVKLYFMIGLPAETEDDIVAIAALAEAIRKELRLSVSLSVNAFVPKPGTPWGDRAFVGIAGAERRFRLLKSAISESLGRGCEIRFSSAREADLEYRLSWGGPEMVDWMETLVDKRKRGRSNAI